MHSGMIMCKKHAVNVTNMGTCRIGKLLHCQECPLLSGKTLKGHDPGMILEEGKNSVLATTSAGERAGNCAK